MIQPAPAALALIISPIARQCGNATSPRYISLNHIGLRYAAPMQPAPVAYCYPRPAPAALLLIISPALRRVADMQPTLAPPLQCNPLVRRISRNHIIGYVEMRQCNPRPLP